MPTGDTTTITVATTDPEPGSSTADWTPSTPRPPSPLFGNASRTGSPAK
jgi:hypothetical protein